MKYLLSLSIVILLILGNPHSIRSQAEVTLIVPLSIKTAIDHLLPGFERKTGRRVRVTFGTGGGILQQVTHGEAFDVAIVQPPFPEVLVSGNVVTSSETFLGSVSVGVAVPKGAPKPDISTPDAVKHMLLAAKSISYPDPSSGAIAGVSIDEMIKKLGIFEQLQPKIKRRDRAGVVALVASGEVEIGMTFLSEMNQPGIDIVGGLPREISTPTRFVGFVSSHAKDAAAAKELLTYLSSSEAAAVSRMEGMEPGR